MVQMYVTSLLQSSSARTAANVQTTSSQGAHLHHVCISLPCFADDLCSITIEKQSIPLQIQHQVHTVTLMGGIADFHCPPVPPSAGRNEIEPLHILATQHPIHLRPEPTIGTSRRDQSRNRQRRDHTDIWLPSLDPSNYPCGTSQPHSPDHPKDPHQ